MYTATVPIYHTLSSPLRPKTVATGIHQHTYSRIAATHIGVYCISYFLYAKYILRENISWDLKVIKYTKKKIGAPCLCP